MHSSDGILIGSFVRVIPDAPSHYDIAAAVFLSPWTGPPLISYSMAGAAARPHDAFDLAPSAMAPDFTLVTAMMWPAMAAGAPRNIAEPAPLFGLGIALIALGIVMRRRRR